MSRLGRIRSTWTGLSLLCMTIALAGCGGEPTPPRLVHFSPVVLLVPTDETVAIRVVYERNDFELTDFAWRVEAGEAEGDGGAEIVYAAPSEPGNYRISVTAAYGEGERAGEVSLASSLKVIPGASRLAVEELDEPGEGAKTTAGTEGAGRASGEVQGDGETAEETASEPDEGADEPEGEAPAVAAETTDALEAAEDEAGKDAAPAASTAAPADPEAAEAKAAEPRTDHEQTAPVAGAAPAKDSRLDRILADEQLLAAVQIDFRPFSLEDAGGERVGFDIDLVREFARRWLDDPSAAELLPVPTAERIPKLLAGEADIVVAALTKTPERAAQVDFSQTYFQDGQRLLVAEGSEAVSVCDLGQVAAIEGSTSLENLEREARACGFEPSETIVVFERHADAVQALIDGRVAAFTSDGMALEGFAADRPLEVVGNHFSEEPYGIAVPKGDRRLLELVDATLAEMAADGTFAAIYAKWFGDEIAPYPLDGADVAVDSSELAALVTSDTPSIFVPEDDEPETGGTEAVEEYVVEPGDTLSKIAGKLHGDVSPAAWQPIYEANRDLIGDDPSRLQAGMTLVIPE